MIFCSNWFNMFRITISFREYNPNRTILSLMEFCTYWQCDEMKCNSSSSEEMGLVTVAFGRRYAVVPRLGGRGGVSLDHRQLSRLTATRPEGPGGGGPGGPGGGAMVARSGQDCRCGSIGHLAHSRAYLKPFLVFPSRRGGSGPPQGVHKGTRRGPMTSRSDHQGVHRVSVGGPQDSVCFP